MMAETGASVSKGSGRDGRVTKEDVVVAVASMGENLVMRIVRANASA